MVGGVCPPTVHPDPCTKVHCSREGFCISTLLLICSLEMCISDPTGIGDIFRDVQCNKEFCVGIEFEKKKTTLFSFVPPFVHLSLPHRQPISPSHVCALHQLHTPHRQCIKAKQERSERKTKKQAYFFFFVQKRCESFSHRKKKCIFFLNARSCLQLYYVEHKKESIVYHILKVYTNKFKFSKRM